MNKKGFLLGEETLKIVLSVIAIGFLVFFLVSIYYSYTRDKELEFAKASLEHFISETNSRAEQVEIYNPKKWWITSWPYNGEIPNSCLNLDWSACICICKKDNVKSCDEKGTCLESDFVVEGENDNSIKIDNPPLILIINYEDNTIIKEEI